MKGEIEGRPSEQIHFRVSCLVITFQREFLLSVPSEQLITSLVPTQLSSTQLSVMATLLSGKPLVQNYCFQSHDIEQ